MPARGFRIPLGVRFAGALCAAAALAAAATSAFGFWGGLLAGLAAGAAASALLVGRMPEVLAALEDALGSLREHEYTVRIDEGRSGALRRISSQLNALGAALSRERNDTYQKELLFETVLEIAPTAIVVCDDAERVVVANSAARDLLNEGRRLTGLTLPEVLARCAPEVGAAMRSREDALFSVERGGETETYLAVSRWFELNALRHRVHLLRPFTRELARREVEVWKKSIRVISHELANSLAAIISMVHSARTLRERLGQGERLDQVLEAVEQRATALRTFLEGYAQFARLPRPEKREVPWEDFLAGVRALYPFSVEGTPPLAPGWFDPAQLQQALINLLKNAVEAGSAPDQCAVRVSSLLEGGAELLVLDRGTGMPDDVRRRALEPFYTTKKRGSGLGLPLCREIVEAHGGRIWLSPRDGGGTSVRIWLPGRA